MLQSNVGLVDSVIIFVFKVNCRLEIVNKLKKVDNCKNEEKKQKKIMELPGIEPGTFHMRSERSTPELQPHLFTDAWAIKAPVVGTRCWQKTNLT